jgi:hypothetical protein
MCMDENIEWMRLLCITVYIYNYVYFFNLKLV